MLVLFLSGNIIRSEFGFACGERKPSDTQPGTLVAPITDFPTINRAHAFILGMGTSPRQSWLLAHNGLGLSLVVSTTELPSTFTAGACSPDNKLARATQHSCSISTTVSPASTRASCRTSPLSQGYTTS